LPHRRRDSGRLARRRGFAWRCAARRPRPARLCAGGRDRPAGRRGRGLARRGGLRHCSVERGDCVRTI